MKRIALIMVLILVFCFNTYAVDVLHYEPAIVTLVGKLVTKMFYGPPNYGLNPKEDKKENVFILELDHSITIEADQKDELNETHSGEKEIQVVNLSEANLKQFLGKRIKITGSLFSAMNGHHHTNVLIMVKRIKDIEILKH